MRAYVYGIVVSAKVKLTLWWGAMVLCSAPRVTVIWYRAATVWCPDAPLRRPCDGASWRWRRVAAPMPREGALGGVASCVGAVVRLWLRRDGVGAWERREFGSGALVTSSGRRMGVASSARRPSSCRHRARRGVVALPVVTLSPWCGRCVVAWAVGAWAVAV